MGTGLGNLFRQVNEKRMADREPKRKKTHSASDTEAEDDRLPGESNMERAIRRHQPRPPDATSPCRVPHARHRSPAPLVARSPRSPRSGRAASSRESSAPASKAASPRKVASPSAEVPPDRVGSGSASHDLSDFEYALIIITFGFWVSHCATLAGRL